jgi:hypothetical protein
MRVVGKEFDELLRKALCGVRSETADKLSENYDEKIDIED